MAKPSSVVIVTVLCGGLLPEALPAGGLPRDDAGTWSAVYCQESEAMRSVQGFLKAWRILSNSSKKFRRFVHAEQSGKVQVSLTSNLSHANRIHFPSLVACEFSCEMPPVDERTTEQGNLWSFESVLDECKSAKSGLEATRESPAATHVSACQGSRFHPEMWDADPSAAIAPAPLRRAPRALMPEARKVSTRVPSDRSRNQGRL